MAEEVSTQSRGGKKGRKGKSKKMSTRIDYTPMVDLGMLLITFFMLTTTLIKPQTMEIAMPSKEKLPEEQQTKVKASKAITIILVKNNKIFYYEGTREHDIDPPVNTTDFSATGIRRYLIQRNYDVMKKVDDLREEREKTKMSQEDFDKRRNEIISDKQAPIIIIKATNDASYKNLIDILDEMAICNIGRYAIVDITDYDIGLIKNLNI
jgi:biopolymer transport protein ExbD